MKTFFKRALMLPLMASVLMLGCNKDEDDPIPVPVSPVEGKILVASGTATGAEVDIEVYSDQKLIVGYNKLYTLIYKQGTQELLSDAKVTYKMLMSMTSGMNHLCPTEQPSTTTPSNRVFDGAIIPIMPSGAMGSWNLEVSVDNNDNGKQGAFSIDVEALEPTDARVFSFISSVDSNKYFVTMMEPTEPEVGINDFEMAVHQKKSMMELQYRVVMLL